MNLGPRARRYWSSLTGIGTGTHTDAGIGDAPSPERHWRGQPFRRRYVASFFVLPQPLAGGVPNPHRVRAPQLFRYQPAVLAGAGVLVIVFSATQLGTGSSSADTSGAKPPTVGAGTNAPAQPPASTPTSPSPTTTAPTKIVPWQGTLRVSKIGEEVTTGPPRVAGLRFGLAVSGPGALVGSGNLVPWTTDATPTAATCLALLKAHAVYQVTVQAGDQICIAALDGRTASAKVADEGTGSDGTPYIDLTVLAYTT